MSLVESAEEWQRFGFPFQPNAEQFERNVYVAGLVQVREVQLFESRAINRALLGKLGPHAQIRHVLQMEQLVMRDLCKKMETV